MPIRLKAPNRLANKPSSTLLRQLGVIIVVKILVLLGVWFVVFRGNKVQGHAEATADYFLTQGATPQKQIIPRSPWE